MKCKYSTGDCTLQLKILEDQSVVEFCSMCNYTYVHKFENIKNNYLSPYKKQN